MQLEGCSSVPGREEVIEFIIYYRNELINGGWQETGLVDGEGGYTSFCKRVINIWKTIC